MESRAASLREALAPIAESAPGDALTAAIAAGLEGAEDSLGAHLALETAAAFGAEEAGATQAAALAIALLEGAERLEGSVHGLADRPVVDADNPAAGLAAAWLRARSSELAAEVGPEAQLRHARAGAAIADGWIGEAEDLYDAGRTPDRCLAAIARTRGGLCSAAAALGGLAAGLDEAGVDALASYGEPLGVAAKICEDSTALVPALTQSPGRAGDAIARGVYSLPVAYALEEDSSLARSLGGRIKDDDLEGILERVRAAGGITRAATHCRRVSGEAVAALEGLDSPDELASLAQGVAGRCEEVALA